MKEAVDVIICDSLIANVMRKSTYHRAFIYRVQTHNRNMKKDLCCAS